MGCWNGTDVMTNLPIMSGDKVKLIIIVKNAGIGEGLNGACYTTDVCDVVSLPISGEYDDYGCIENIEENANTEAILKHFTGNGLVNKDKEIVSTTYTNIEDLIKGIERGKVYIHDTFSGEDKKVMFSLVLKDIWDSVIEHMQKETSYFYSGAEDSKEQTYQNAYQKRINEFFDGKKKYHELLKKAKECKDDEERQAILLDASIASMSDVSSRHPIFGNGFRFIKYQNEDPKGYDTFKELFYEMAIFECAMNQSRRAWLPPNSAGSQSEEFSLHKRISEITLNHTNAKIKEREEWEE